MTTAQVSANVIGVDFNAVYTPGTDDPTVIFPPWNDGASVLGDDQKHYQYAIVLEDIPADSTVVHVRTTDVNSYVFDTGTGTMIVGEQVTDSGTLVATVTSFEVTGGETGTFVGNIGLFITAGAVVDDNVLTGGTSGATVTFNGTTPTPVNTFYATEGGGGFVAPPESLVFGQRAWFGKDW